VAVTGPGTRCRATFHRLNMVDPAEPSLPASRRLHWCVVGLVTGWVASAVIGAVVITATGYDPDVASGVGTDLGRTAMQLVNDVDFDDHRLPIRLLAILQVPLWLGLLGAPLMASREGMSWKRDLRWSMKPSDVPVGIASGLALQLVLVPLLYVPIFWLFGDQDVEEAARSLVGRAHGPLDVVTLVLVSVVGAPIIEEIFFRGLLFGTIADRRSSAMAIAVSATVFAATHLQLVQFPALVLVGVVHAVLVGRSGRLGPAVWSHAAFNAVTVFVLLGR
jgi:membrane protease YdiL (CAAX protease family)